jgi:hypothetical protein
MDCFKDVEWSMGESGHRRARVGFRDSKAVIRGDNDFISNSRRSLQRLAISPRTLMTYQQQQQHCTVLQSSDPPSVMPFTLRSFPRPLGQQKQKRCRPGHDKLTTLESLGLNGDRSSVPTD